MQYKSRQIATLFGTFYDRKVGWPNTDVRLALQQDVFGYHLSFAAAGGNSMTGMKILKLTIG